ncbi:hypothetical protein HK105_205999 [Polyrhizophydium stewartii]|uniref:Uncharacterized protein n=1 Tax=Polyrhizophydium stewartii TaxID=2732419 RepID=A0ABR4N4H1_9FUNG|nr:hypothetical protein HK105_003456 [Polyrhizophydium stewartii]
MSAQTTARPTSGPDYKGQLRSHQDHPQGNRPPQPQPQSRPPPQQQQQEGQASLSELAEGASHAASEGGHKAAEYAQSGAESAGGMAKQGYEGASSTVQQGMDVVRETAQQGVQYAQQAGEKTYESVKQLAQQGMQTASQAIQQGQDMTHRATSWASERLQEAPPPVKSAAEEIAHTLSQMWEHPISTTIDLSRMAVRLYLRTLWSIVTSPFRVARWATVKTLQTGDRYKSALMTRVALTARSIDKFCMEYANVPLVAKTRSG